MRIALVGTADSSRRAAPFDDPEWSIWSTARNYDIVKNYDKWFELHGIEYLKSIKIVQEHLDFLKVAGDRVVLKEYSSEYPKAQVYPQQEVMDYYSRHNIRLGRYFTSSVSWMLAWAIMLQPEEIGLWGIDMVLDEEYSLQRAGCETLLGLAIGKGIKVTLPDECPLLKAGNLYGFEDISPMEKALRMRIAEAEKEKEEHTAKMKDAAAHVNHRQGMLDAFKSIQRI